MDEGTCVAEKESPVFQQVRIIDDKLAALTKTSQTLAERLSNILSAQIPPPEPDKKDSAKSERESVLVSRLYGIRNTLESQISSLQDVTNRLTI